MSGADSAGGRNLFAVSRGSAVVQERKGSYMVTIPSKVADSLGLSKGDELEFAHRQEGQPALLKPSDEVDGELGDTDDG